MKIAVISVALTQVSIKHSRSSQTIPMPKLGMGRLELMVGNDAQAKKRDDEVLLRDPGNIQGEVLQAALLARNGDVDGAIAIASQASKGDAIPAAAGAVLAGLYTAKKDYPKALEVVQKSLASNPNDVTLLLIAAKLSQVQHQPEQVTAFYKRASDTAPKNFVIWQDWAASQEQGRPARSSRAGAARRDQGIT